MNALYVTTNNTVCSVDCPDKITFEWAKKLIKCYYIEIVRPQGLPRKYVMLIDEEGKLQPHAMNPICSTLYGYEKHGVYIAGNALIVKEALVDGEPDLIGLDEEDVKALHIIIAREMVS